MDKFTKGPWKIIGTRVCTEGNDKQRTTIAVVGSTAPNYVIQDANVNLIAAAPRLLEACRIAEDYFNKIRRTRTSGDSARSLYSEEELSATLAVRNAIIDATGKLV